MRGFFSSSTVSYSWKAGRSVVVEKTDKWENTEREEALKEDRIPLGFFYCCLLYLPVYLRFFFEALASTVSPVLL